MGEDCNAGLTGSETQRIPPQRTLPPEAHGDPAGPVRRDTRGAGGVQVKARRCTAPSCHCERNTAPHHRWEALRYGDVGISGIPSGAGMLPGARCFPPRDRWAHAETASDCSQFRSRHVMPVARYKFLAGIAKISCSIECIRFPGGLNLHPTSTGGVGSPPVASPQPDPPSWIEILRMFCYLNCRGPRAAEGNLGADRFREPASPPWCRRHPSQCCREPGGCGHPSNSKPRGSSWTGPVGPSGECRGGTKRVQPV